MRAAKRSHNFSVSVDRDGEKVSLKFWKQEAVHKWTGIAAKVSIS